MGDQVANEEREEAEEEEETPKLELADKNVCTFSTFSGQRTFSLRFPFNFTWTTKIKYQLGATRFIKWENQKSKIVLTISPHNPFCVSRGLGSTKLFEPRIRAAIKITELRAVCKASIHHTYRRFNPFTASVCNISGLNSADIVTRLQTVYLIVL